jgi:transposase
MWCMPVIDDEFVTRMEDVLELYARPYNELEPVVCLDERPVVLRDSERVGLPLRPGKPERVDYEYVRRGTANIFCIVEPLTGRRLTHATERRTGRDFAEALRMILRRYPTAKTIHLVLDNLNTHCQKSCVDAFGQLGRELWRRFTVHYTPKHGSWLNAAELEASLVSRECLGRRRIPELQLLRDEVEAWRQRADADRRSINWAFRVDDARRVFCYYGITTLRSEH